MAFDHALLSLAGQQTDVEGVTVLDGPGDGPVVAFMGLVHGNEPAGLAIWHTLSAIEKIRRGRIKLIVGHPEAAFRRSPPVRQVEEDLNRAFFFDAFPQSRRDTVETRRVQDLRRALAGVDVLVDFHTTSSVTEPFCALFGKAEETALFRSTRNLAATTGWDRFVSGSGVQWVKHQGGRGFIVEAGQHHDPESSKVVSTVIYDVLADLGMVDGSSATPANRGSAIIFDIIQRMSIEGNGLRYRRKPRNFAPVLDGEIIAEDDRRVYRAPFGLGGAGVLVMPTSEEAFKDQLTLDGFFIGVGRPMPHVHIPGTR